MSFLGIHYRGRDSIAASCEIPRATTLFTRQRRGSMISLISATSSHPVNDSYVAIAVLITVGTGSFVDPNKGKFYKWLYWVIVPLAGVALLAAATNSIIAGLALGSIVFVILAAGYARYNFDKW